MSNNTNAQVIKSVNLAIHTLKNAEDTTAHIPKDTALIFSQLTLDNLNKVTNPTIDLVDAVTAIYIEHKSHFAQNAITVLMLAATLSKFKDNFNESSDEMTSVTFASLDMMDMTDLNEEQILSIMMEEVMSDTSMSDVLKAFTEQQTKQILTQYLATRKENNMKNDTIVNVEVKTPEAPAVTKQVEVIAELPVVEATATEITVTKTTTEEVTIAATPVVEVKQPVVAADRMAAFLGKLENTLAKVDEKQAILKTGQHHPKEEMRPNESKYKLPAIITNNIPVMTSARLGISQYLIG